MIEWLPWKQGSWLEMRPEKMKAFDQDLGINSSIQYAWNAGQHILINSIIINLINVN